MLRRTALEGFVRAQWLAAELGGGRVQEDATARRVAFTDPGARPDCVYPGRHDRESWNAAARYVRESQRQRRACVLLVDDSTDASLAAHHVADLGLQPEGEAACMVLADLESISTATPPGLAIEPVSAEPARQSFIDTAAAVFGAHKDMFELLYPKAMVGSVSLQGALGVVDGTVCAVASAYIVDGAVGVYGVAVEPTLRGRGVERAMTAWACNVGRSHGASFAYLQPSPMGQALYRQMGFVTVGGYRKFVHRPSSSG